MTDRTPDEPSDALRTSRQRYTQLLERTRDRYGNRADITEEALQELSTALEELRVTEEELRIQNEILLAANDTAADDAARTFDVFLKLPLPCLVTRATGAIEHANEAAVSLLGLKSQRLIGKPLTVFVRDEERRNFRSAINQLAFGSAPRRSFNTVLVRRSAGSQTVAVRVEASSFGAGTEARISWIFQTESQQSSAFETRRFEEEHSERLLAERAVRRFRFLAEIGRQTTGERDIRGICGGVARAIVKYAADHCSVYLIDGSQLVSYACIERDPRKAQFAELLRKRYRITTDDIDGTIWRSILTGDPQVVPPLQEDGNKDAGMRRLFAQLRTQGARNAVILPLRRNDHSYGAIVAMVTSPVPSFTTEDVGVLLEVATRTALAIENAQLLDKLERANDEKSEFLAVVSHELRTPLTAMIGYAELLLAGIPDPLGERARQHADRIRTSAWHQLTIVEQLLNHARPEAIEEQLHRVPIDLAQLVDEVAQLVAGAAEQKQLELRVDVPAAITLNTDAGRLRQILINLLYNAVKYTDMGSIECHVRGSDESVFIAVTDTGPGIPEESLARIFDSYWRGTQTGTGVGLGLNVSRKLARLLGGDLTVESEIGAGSTFTLKLPVE